ncbi:MAG: DUF3187 family protein [Gammaproteobacteria bacterium]|nr:DUF3187 family protein [Gammaproteobacteria bacterium]
MLHAPRTSFRTLFSLLFLIGNGAYAASVSETRPLYSFNQSPLIQIYGLPALGEARVLAHNQSNLALRMQIANNFTGARSNVELLNLDGEMHRLSLEWRQGLGGGMEWGAELPYVSYTGGFLDSTIERFHKATGLPQGGRENVALNQIDFHYARNGVDLVNLDHSASGPGDLRLFAAKQLDVNKIFSDFDAALRISLKLPTGNEKELLGSGSTDLALWLSAARTQGGNAWNPYGGAGVLLMSETKVLPSLQRKYVGFGTLGVSHKFFPQLAFNLQVDGHSPFYEGSSYRQLSAYSAQGLAGASWEISRRQFLEFSVSEDIITNTSPDVVFNFSFSTPF